MKRLQEPGQIIEETAKTAGKRGRRKETAGGFSPAVDQWRKQRKCCARKRGNTRRIQFRRWIKGGNKGNVLRTSKEETEEMLREEMRKQPSDSFRR